MSSFYSVIQYSPDPATGERLNMGLVAWDENNVICDFTNNWRRLRSIAGEDLSFLHLFAEEFRNLVNECNYHSKRHMSKEYFKNKILGLSNKWNSKFQVTETRGSLKNAAATISDLSPVFLAMLPTDRVRRRTRSTAVALTVRALRSAVGKTFAVEDIERYIEIRPEIVGKLESHTLDVGLKNGRLITAAHALSFEGSDEKHLEKEVESTAWIVEDLKRADKSVSLAVIALPPTVVTKTAFQRAEKLFGNMKIPFVLENNLSDWAGAQAHRLAQHVR